MRCRDLLMPGKRIIEFSLTTDKEIYNHSQLPSFSWDVRINLHGQKKKLQLCFGTFNPVLLHSRPTLSHTKLQQLFQRHKDGIYQCKVCIACYLKIYNTIFKPLLRPLQKSHLVHGEHHLIENKINYLLLK